MCVCACTTLVFGCMYMCEWKWRSEPDVGYFPSLLACFIVCFLFVCFCSETWTFTELEVRRRGRRGCTEWPIRSMWVGLRMRHFGGFGVPNLGPQADVLGTWLIDCTISSAINPKHGLSHSGPFSEWSEISSFEGKLNPRGSGKKSGRNSYQETKGGFLLFFFQVCFGYSFSHLTSIS